MADVVENFILPNIYSVPVYAKFVAHRLARMNQNFALLGSPAECEYFRAPLEARNIAATFHEWDFGNDISAAVQSSETPRTIIVLRAPTLQEHWVELQTLRRQFGNRLLGLNELILPITTFSLTMGRLPYSTNTLEDVASFYLGEKSFRADLNKLQAVFPLAGKSAIEFGPLEGLQTAFLVNSGASRVLCIEARAENAVKTLVAKQALGWDQVEIVMDDFHNVDASKYGLFDLAFAHGVYYHSIAPFVFLENLVSLSDQIYLGGFCATADNPKGEYVTLADKGNNYRAKAYREGGAGDFYAGVNSVGYFFNGEDLIAFFTRQGYRVEILEDQARDAQQCAGRYLRFFARRDKKSD